MGQFRDKNWPTHLWERIKSLVSGLNTRVSALESGGAGGQAPIQTISLNGTNVAPDVNKNVALVEADPNVPAWAKQNTKPSYTAQEVGAQQDLGLYIDAQGYICQRIGSDQT